MKSFLWRKTRFELEYLRDEKTTQIKVLTSLFWFIITIVELKIFDAIMWWAFLGTHQIPDAQWKTVITLFLYVSGIWIGVVAIGIRGWERACSPFYDELEFVR